MDIRHFIQEQQAAIEAVLSDCLQVADPLVLHQAMAYAVFNGGKRLRPLLAYAGAETLGASRQCADIPAAALELIHSYSLIHDDLPAMDDDDLRRGKPSCHVRFDEATAILAGDALQALAFELLSASPRLTVSAEVRLQMLGVLSRAAGWQGMVAGQSIDVTAAGGSMTEDELMRMHELKTGALIAASVQLGALSTGGADEQDLAKLAIYGQALGLAFQIQDDILDVESDTGTLGKRQGKDAAGNKPTYPALLGLDNARTRARRLCDRGIAALDGFGPAAKPLIDLACYIVQRKY